MSKKDASGAAVILEYLNEKNRPYSAQDIFGNLQKQHGLGKTAVVKAMELLAQEGKIMEKVYGKQKIYFADQSQFADVSDSDLKEMDSQMSQLNSQVHTVTQDCKQLEMALKELNSSMTTQGMTSEIQHLTQECTAYKERLERIKSVANHVTPEEKEKVSDAHHFKIERMQTSLASDMVDAILEGYPKSKKQFLEEVGLETDEDCKVKIPDM
uniref:Homologous-pairing protein 2 homolog n=1 Tax=Paramormyrops kingsleyae TaxID=1676925 RepID=A0A3B3Q517_9TELE